MNPVISGNNDQQPTGLEPISTRRATAAHVHYNGLNIDTRHVSPPQASPQPVSRSDTELHREHNFSPILRRRSTRAGTFKTVDDYDEFDTSYSARPGWQPGSEPGYDPTLPDGGHASMPMLSAPCTITVVDFSLDDMVKRHFDNQAFIDFLEQPQEPWVKCRWINVNGLSWDVIQAVGNKKGLHKLALEDIMNIRNRTKTDWCVRLSSSSRGEKLIDPGTRTMHSSS